MILKVNYLSVFTVPIGDSRKKIPTKKYTHIITKPIRLVSLRLESNKNIRDIDIIF